MALVASGQRPQHRFCERKHPDATQKERLIGGRDGASNHPRRAALEHRGNPIRTPRPPPATGTSKARTRLRMHREQRPKCKNQNPRSGSRRGPRYFDQRPPKRSRNHRWPLVSQRIVVEIHPPVMRPAQNRSTRCHRHTPACGLSPVLGRIPGAESCYEGCQPLFFGPASPKPQAPDRFVRTGFCKARLLLCKSLEAKERQGFLLSRNGAKRSGGPQRSEEYLDSKNPCRYGRARFWSRRAAVSFLNLNFWKANAPGADTRKRFPHHGGLTIRATCYPRVI